jgi:hypothetical protein
MQSVARDCRVHTARPDGVTGARRARRPRHPRLQSVPNRDLVVGDRQAADFAPRHQHSVVVRLRDGAGAQQLLQLLHNTLLVLIAVVEVVGYRVLDDRVVEGELQQSMEQFHWPYTAADGISLCARCAPSQSTVHRISSACAAPPA